MIEPGPRPAIGVAPCPAEGGPTFWDWRPRPGAALALLFLAALLLRLGYLFDLRGYEFHDRLDLDPKAYDEKALSIVEGRSPSPGRPFYQAPLYPYFLASLYAVAGHDYDAIRLVQAILGALSVVILARIGIVLSGTAAGLAAGAAAALYGPFPFYEAQIMKTSLALFLVLAGTLLLVGEHAVARRRLLAAGFALGLAALVRENALLFLVAAAVASGWGRRGAVDPRRAAFVFVGALAAIAPVTIRNWAVSGDPVLITSQGGQNFYIGNNVLAAGTYTDLPFVRPDPRYEEEDFRRETARRLGREPGAAAISRFWYAEALRWMKENPGAALRLLARKAALFWDAAELPDNENFYYMRRRFAWLRAFPLTFGVVASLGLTGAFLSIRRFRELFLVYAGVGVAWAALTAFYVFSRYRLAAVPFLILFAAEGGRIVAREVHGRRGRRLAGVAALLAASISLVYLYRPIDFDPEIDGFLPLHVNRAMLFLESGENRRAIEEYRRALALAPDRGELRKRLARLLLDEGMRKEGTDELARAVRLLPRDGALRNDLALLLIEEGNRRGAIALLRQAILVAPDLEAPHRNLGTLLVEEGSEEEGRRHLAVADSLREAGGGP